MTTKIENKNRKTMTVMMAMEEVHKLGFNTVEELERETEKNEKIKANLTEFLQLLLELDVRLREARIKREKAEQAKKGVE
jgi:cell shape-determining protein MreC